MISLVDPDAHFEQFRSNSSARIGSASTAQIWRPILPRISPGCIDLDSRERLYTTRRHARVGANSMKHLPLMGVIREIRTAKLFVDFVLVHRRPLPARSCTSRPHRSHDQVRPHSTRRRTSVGRLTLPDGDAYRCPCGPVVHALHPRTLNHRMADEAVAGGRVRSLNDADELPDRRHLGYETPRESGRPCLRARYPDRQR